MYFKILKYNILIIILNMFEVYVWLIFMVCFIFGREWVNLWNVYMYFCRLILFLIWKIKLGLRV